jgi:hypothetical protein
MTLFYGIMASSTWTETVAVCLEAGFPFGFQSILDNWLYNTVFNDGNATVRLHTASTDLREV